MPWYAVLLKLPAGYDNTVQQVWYVGKTYRVSSYNHDTTAVHTPNGIEKEWRISKSMARRLFDEPYYMPDGQSPSIHTVVKSYQQQVLDAIQKHKQEELEQKKKHEQDIRDLKRDMDSILYDSQGNDRFSGY